MKTFKIQYILTLLTLLFGTMSATSAADRFYAEATIIKPGETKQLSFILENSQEFFGFQTDIKLPAGLTFVTSDGKADVSLSSRADGGTYNIVSNLLSDNSLRLGAFSASHKAFSGNDGVLFHAMVSAGEGFSGGKVSLSNVRFIDSDDHDVKLADSSTEILLYVEAESITISKTAQIKIGESVTLTATVLPETATDKTVTWSSSDETVATVDGNGKVTAIAVGEATITAKCGEVTANCKVTVLPIQAESVTLSQTTAQLKAGESVTLTATVLPENTTDKTVIWTSSNKDIATVDKNGKVTAIAVGEATITAKCGEVTANCKVTVIPTPAESVTLSQTTAQLKAGESVTLTATVLPENTTDKTVTWTSSNKDIAMVDKNGKVMAIAVGEATITASCGSVNASCKVSVVATPAESVTLSQTTAQLKAGESVTLTATVLPETATDKTVTWSSSDETVAKVDANGKVTAIAVGEATITAKCGEVTANCKVTVIPTPAESVTLSQTTVQLKAGESVTLKATILPENTTDKTVTWTSSNKDIATVDKNGKVTAIAVGEATITAKCGEVTANCKVTVLPIQAESVTLSQTTAQLKAGESVTLTATVLPENTTDKTVTWTSSNKDIATVDKNGKVTAIAVGEATITAKCGEVTANCKVTVIPTPAESVTLSQTTAQLKAGESVTLTATVLPENATDKTVTWTSSNKDIATVDKNGKVTAIAVGEVTITAKCGEVTANCKVTVIPTPAESVTLSQTTAQLKVGESVTLTATVLPETATDKTVIWTSSDETVAKVDANGKVTAITIGEATITASCGSVNASCKVSVVATPAESVTLSQTTAQLKAGESVTLKATVLPENATDKSVTWSSSDETVAKVDANGKVTAIAVGEATITASCGSVNAGCKVSVVATPAESVTLSQTTAQLKAGESVTLKATVLPENATDKTVTWTSSNKDIATVDKNGKVTAIAVGETTITATCGSVSANCTVTVVATPAESITLSQTTAQLKAGESVTLKATVLPETATDKSVTWSSSNETVATVDTNGKVTAVAVGEATITASCGSVNASCQVTVLPILAESLTLSHESWTGEEGENFALIATVLPENTTDKSVTWSSSDETVATVDDNGNVSVLKEGYCIITASTQDGSNLSAECIITGVSGINDIFTNAEATFDVYSLQGILIKKDCSHDYLKRLSTGAYILRQGNINKKIIIR